MTKEERIAALEKAIASPATPDRLRANMRQTLDELTTPEPEEVFEPYIPPPPPAPKRIRPSRAKPKPVPPAPKAKELTPEEAEALEEKYRKRRARKLTQSEE